MRDSAAFFLKLNRIIATSLAVCLASADFAGALAQSAPDADGNYSVRHRDTPDGLYESSYGNALRGKKLSDLSPEGLKAYFDAHPELKSESQAYDMATGQAIDPTKKATDRRILYVVGVPLFGKERTETMSLVQKLAQQNNKSFKQWMNDFFYLDKSNPETHIRPISRPGGSWKVVQNFMYPMISPSDIAPVSKGVLWEGFQSVMWSAGIGLGLQLFIQLGEQGQATHALAIVIPAWIINTLQSTWTSLPRPWWSNYFRRAEAIAAPLVSPVLGRGRIPDKVSRVFGSIAQQIWMTVFFTVNVFTAGQGSIEKAVEYMSIPGFFEIMKKKANSMALNIWWRTPVENSLADYVEGEAALKRGSVAEKEAARIRKILTIISTNLWVYSTLTQMNWEALGYKWNFGHLGMFLMGTFGIGAWAVPKVYRSFTKSGRAYKATCSDVVSNL